MMRLAAIVVAVLAAVPATAQVVEDCDWRASAGAIVEPWEDYSRSFANGDVRLALSDVVEPAAGAFHVVILSPPYDEVGGRQCRVVSAVPGIGFAAVDWQGLEADYDPARGLVWQVPVGMFDIQTGAYEVHPLVITLNQSSGAIGADLLSPNP